MFATPPVLEMFLRQPILLLLANGNATCIPMCDAPARHDLYHLGLVAPSSCSLFVLPTHADNVPAWLTILAKPPRPHVAAVLSRYDPEVD